MIDEPVIRGTIRVPYFDVWYDHQHKTWYLTEFTADGDQIGESEFGHYRNDVIRRGRQKIGERLMGLRVWTQNGRLLRIE